MDVSVAAVVVAAVLVVVAVVEVFAGALLDGVCAKTVAMATPMSSSGTAILVTLIYGFFFPFSVGSGSFGST